MTKLTHISQDGKATMVDVSAKNITRRTATASGKVLMSQGTVAALKDQQLPKGDPLETARLAGIMAAKNTSNMIPLCHPLGIEHVDVKATLVDDGVTLSSEIVVTGKTGAEMEALAAVGVAALTIYDMCKAIDKSMVISDVRLESKTGGKSGEFKRSR